MSDSGSPNMQQKPEGAEQSEHLNIKVTDNNNEVFFKIKRTTQLKKLMDAFCDRQGKSFASVRFLFEGVRVQPTDNPESVSDRCFLWLQCPIPSNTPPYHGSSCLEYQYRTRKHVYRSPTFSPLNRRLASLTVLTFCGSSKCKTAIRSRSTRSRLAAVDQAISPTTFDERRHHIGFPTGRQN
ncbi:hypothetical protein BU16DRAFT_619329, partial [Lophium mytilinum]